MAFDKRGKMRLKQIEPLHLIGRYGGSGLTGGTGPSNDGVYGQFNSPNIEDGDLMEDAFDKVVDLLDALVPPSAPNLNEMNINPVGVTGKLSWGSSNTISDYIEHPTLDSTELYVSNGTSLGIYESKDISGTLATDVSVGPGTPQPAYPSKSFGSADKGALELKLNGYIIHSINLTTFTNGSDFNSNGSGFSLSSADPSVFSNGMPFENFKYRTGTLLLHKSEIENGYNTVSVEHIVGGTVHDTQKFDFVIDNSTNGLTESNVSLNGLNMLGSNYLSGVEYHTSGTGMYNFDLDGVYLNTYSNSNSAISHTTSNCQISSSEIDNFIANENETLIVNKQLTVDSNNTRVIGNVDVGTDIKRTVQANHNIPNVSGLDILLDTVDDTSTETDEPMIGEKYRLNSDIENNLDDVTGWSPNGSSNYIYDSSKSLVGNDSLYNNGLQLFNGNLIYPGVDFSAISDGPSGNVDYSASSGDRVYYRFFHIESSQNFIMNINGTSTTFVEATNSLTGDEAKIELLAPTQTKMGGTTTWKDCMVEFTNDDEIGAYSGSSGGANVGDINGQDWGLSIGQKSTAGSGDVIILKITSSDSWSGSILNINITKV